MNETKQVIGFHVQLHTDFDTAVERVVDALKTEGFGVLTEIDVKDTLKNKLDVDFRPYKILGACNPPLAYRALITAPEIGLLLPCNITVSQVNEQTIQVSIVDPLSMFGVVANAGLESIAQEAYEKLHRVAATLEETE